jgi:hypothetical protein
MLALSPASAGLSFGSVVTAKLTVPPGLAATAGAAALAGALGG